MNPNRPDQEPDQTDLSPWAAAGCGLAMGGADAIPGVSGGTIALILGIYERFIDAIATALRAPFLLATKDGRDRVWRAARLLLPLGAGIAVSYLAATKLLVGKGVEVGLIQNPDTAPYCYAFFFGLVLFSVREPWRRIGAHVASSWLLAAAGAAAAFLLVGLPYVQSEPHTWMLLYGGAGAISVMLLPGVSGSLLLLTLNQYQTVVEAVHDRDLVPLLVFAVGLVAGVTLFVPFLRWLLGTLHDPTMAILTGLMVGALRALWPWKSSYQPKIEPMLNVAPSGSIAGALAAIALGALVIVVLAAFERRLGNDGD